MIKILLKTEEGSQEHTLHEESITLGRSSDNTLKVSDKKCSRKHARIDKTGNEYRLTDLGSGNGLKVNGTDSKTHALAKGDEIRIGLSTITVLDLDTPAPVAAPVAAPPPAPAAVPAPAAAPAPDSASKAPTQRSTGRDAVRGRHTRRSLAHRSGSSNGKWVAIAAVLCIVATVAYVLVNYQDQIFGPQNVSVAAGKSSTSANSGEVDPAVEAAAALSELRSEAGSTDSVSQALINKASDLKDEYGAIEPAFGAILSQLREKRAQEIANLTFPEIETRVMDALKKREYAESVQSLKDLEGTAKQSEAENLLKKVLEEIERDYLAVAKTAGTMEAADQYTAAADYYRTHAERFKGTQYYKKLANKPEMLELLAQAQMESAAAAKKPTAVAMAPKKPVMKKPAPAMKPKPMAPKPAAMKPKPAMRGGSMKPKPAMAGMKKPVAAKPGSTKPAPKPAPIPVPEAGAPAKSMSEAFAAIFGRSLSDEEKNVRPSMRGKERAKPPTKRPRVSKPAVLCTAKRTTGGLFCPACQRTVDKLYDLRQGVCKRCEYEPVKIDMCVKYFFQAACHPEKVGPKPIFC